MPLTSVWWGIQIHEELAEVVHLNMAMGTASNEQATQAIPIVTLGLESGTMSRARSCHLRQR